MKNENVQEKNYSQGKMAAFLAEQFGLKKTTARTRLQKFDKDGILSPTKQGKGKPNSYSEEQFEQAIQLFAAQFDTAGDPADDSENISVADSASQPDEDSAIEDYAVTTDAFNVAVEAEIELAGENLPKGSFTVSNGTDAFKLVAPYFPNGLDYDHVSKGDNREDVFTFTDDSGLFVHAHSTRDKARFNYIEIIDANKDGSKRRPIDISIVPYIAMNIDELHDAYVTAFIEKGKAKEEVEALLFQHCADNWHDTYEKLWEAEQRSYAADANFNDIKSFCDNIIPNAIKKQAEFLKDKIARDCKPSDDVDNIFNLISSFDSQEDSDDDELVDEPDEEELGKIIGKAIGNLIADKLTKKLFDEVDAALIISQIFDECVITTDAFNVAVEAEINFAAAQIVPDNDSQPVFDSNSDTGRQPDIDLGDNFVSAANPARKQNIEMLPNELLEQPRFFELYGDKKSNTPKGWSDPQNQDYYYNLDSENHLLGFDICGHGNGDDYILLDYDNVLDENGNFINDKAKDWFEVFPIEMSTYHERSISGKGFHVLLKPSSQDFAPITNGKHGVFWFDKEKGAKLEIFYKNQARYCLLTGKYYKCLAKTPIQCDSDVDGMITLLLRQIDKQLAAENETVKPTPAQKTKTKSVNTPLVDSYDYDLFRADKMLDAINPADLDDSDWLAVISACKNIGVDYSTVDSWCQNNCGLNSEGKPRYNEKENLDRWNSTNKPGFGIETLHGIAKRFGYAEAEARREYFQLYPDKQPPKTDSVTTSADGKKYDFTKTNAEINSAVNLNKIFEGDISDLRNGERIAEYGKDKIRWLTDDERWLLNENGIWIRNSEKNSCIMPMVKKMAHDLNLKAVSKHDKAVAALFTRQKKVNAAMFFLKGCREILITTKDLNQNKNLFCVQNGVIDLQAGEFMKFSPDFLITNQAGALYDPNADTSFVKKFFADILPDEETRNAVLRYLGYCLTGMKNYHISEFWKGSGANGKSTALDIILRLFGSYGKKLPATGLLENRKPTDGNSATPAIAQLDGDIRLAIIDELPRNARFDAALFKTLVGDETVYSRALYCNPRMVELRAKFIINGNHLPIFDVDDDGMLRRINNVNFTQIFKGKDADPKILQSLSTPENRSALLKILVEEAKHFYAEGLLESDDMKAAKNEYITENDFVSNFVVDNCIVGRGGQIKRKDFEEKLRDAYPREYSRLKKRELLNLILSRIEPHGAIYTKDRIKNNVFENIDWFTE